MIVPVYPVRAPSGVFRKLDSFSIQDIGGGGGINGIFRADF